MGNFKCTLFVVSATVVGLTGGCPGAAASAIGFHEWRKHEHANSLVLPPLYERAPSHVPHLSNASLLRLWEENQYAPILRNAQIEVQLAEAVVARRDLHPARFDRLHPALGHMIRDPNYLEYALSLYRSHTARFVHYHHHLIPVIRGLAMILRQQPPGGVLSESIPPPATSPAPGGTTDSSPPIVLSVPAPSSILLVLIGMGYVFKRRWRPSHPLRPWVG